MEINFTESKTQWNVDTKQLECAVKFSIDVESLSGGHYGRDGVRDRIVAGISDKIINQYLDVNSEEIISRIDIDEIIKRVKLGIVQTVARN